MFSPLIPMPQDLMEPKVSKNGLVALEKRYLLRDLDGNLTETPKELFWRVASSIAIIDKQYEKSEYFGREDELAREFYDMMAEMKFLPNSPTLMNAGLPDGQLAACFVLPIEDDMGSIFGSLHNAAKIFKSGGGVGFSFSNLRAKNSLVKSTQGVASGPVSFMKIYDSAIEQIKQGGKRRGAGIAILRVDHPDILEFVDCKKKDGVLPNFNISVAITDGFMKAVELDTSFSLICPNTKNIVEVVNARELFDKIVNNAWLSAEPGLIFIDTINKANPVPSLGSIGATNPCSELPLHNYSACNLGSINLSAFYPYAVFDSNEFERCIKLATHFLDNVITASVYPLPEITKTVESIRPIGLGIMGFADALFKIGLPYDISNEGTLKYVDSILGYLKKYSYIQSVKLAEERGSYPLAKETGDDKRNCVLNTMAPTGTLSLIAGCSSGIEPVFALAFKKRILDGEELIEVNKVFEEFLDSNYSISKNSILEEVTKTGTLESINLPQSTKGIFITASEITPENHIRMQAEIQKFVDSAISKTINMPNDATVEDVREAYILAHKLGCKGTTVYRDGCRESQVLVVGDTKEKQETPKLEIQTCEPTFDRPDTLQGFTERVNTGSGKMYITVNENEGKPVELFINIGKSGKSTTAKAEAIGRLTSLLLKNNISVTEIIKQLKGIGGENPVFSSSKKGMVLSIPDGVAWVLDKKYSNKEETPSVDGAKSQISTNTLCPECGESMVYQEGCKKCIHCNYSKCG